MLRRRQVQVAVPLSGGQTYIGKMKTTGPFVYWPMNEASGSTIYDRSGNGYNGTIGAGVTLGATGPTVSGHTAMSFSGGANSLLNVYSAGLATNFPYTKGSIAFWYQPDNWINGDVIFQFLVDANNLIKGQKNNTSDRLEYFYNAGGTSKAVAGTGSQTYTNWHWALLTWDITADQLKAYDNNTQIGATATGLGTWAGTLVSNAAVLGASTSATPTWIGDLSDFGIWGKVLNTAERALIYGG